MSQEKRRQKRLEANLFAELVLIPSGDPRGRAVVVDVSLSGVALESEVDLDVNDVVECNIEIPIRFEAKVVRRIMKGQVKRYGLQFKHQSIFDKIFLKRALKGSRLSTKVSL
jgi:hypothetical protein